MPSCLRLFASSDWVWMPSALRPAGAAGLSGDAGAETKTRPDDIEEQMALLEAARDRQPLAYGSAADFQLAQAVRHLKGEPMQLSTRSPGTTLARHQGPKAAP